MRTVCLPLDGDVIEYRVEGESAYGADEILLDRDDDLLRGTGFAESGFAVAPFLARERLAALQEGLRLLLWSAVCRVARRGDESTFVLERYHQLVSDDEHMDIVRTTGLHWPNEALPIPMREVEQRISEIVGVAVAAVNPHVAEQHFQLRVVRPGRPDNNPPHRDVWLARLRHAANIYVPLAGSNQLSSLPIVPGSHRWRESEIERTVAGSRVEGVQYTVPAVTGARRPLRLVRPPVAANEVMVFTPYAIHGGGVNRNVDATRVSLEIRFWRAAPNPSTSPA